MEPAAYVGLPFAPRGRDLERDGGLDCWGLVRHVYARELGLTLPSFHTDYADPTVAGQIDPLVVAEAARWRAVSPGEERALDVVVLRRGRWRAHVGVVTSPGWMLHVEAGVDAALADYRRDRCWCRRVVGCYRHPEAA